MQGDVLQVSNLSVELDAGRGEKRRLLDGISFDLGSNQVIGIIGESGSGKTVLSRALVHWIHEPLRVVGGSILYKGRDLVQLPASEMQRLRGREIAYIGSDPGSALDPTLPVGRQIVEKLRAVEPGISEADARARVLHVLDAVRIPTPHKRFDEFPFQFSGGMMQRALIVDALVTNPAFLVADNITQPLDVTIAAQILRLLRDLQRDFDTAIVFVSSALGIVNEIADSVLVLADGKVVEQQMMKRLLDNPVHPYTKQLIRDVPRIWAVKRRAGPATPEQPGGQEVVLSVKEVSKTFVVRDRNKLFGQRKVQAVRGVSFDTFKGENLGIVGESGCGKSTLSRLLSRVDTPDRGEILFKGRDIAYMSRKELLSLRNGFQLLLQDPFTAIPPHLHVGRTIAESLVIHGWHSRKAIESRVRDTMAEVGLPADLYHSLPVGLSAGQRQRVNIARAMVLNPELLILDETLSALDQVEQSKLLSLFERLQVRYGITYIYITHDLSMVRRVCNRIAVMYLGRIVELGPNESVFFEPGHPYTRALLSAVPAIEDKPFKAETYLLEGEPPDPIDIPPGCSFRTRCPFAFDRCVTDDPVLLPCSGVDLAACHLSDAAKAEGRRLPQVFNVAM